MVDAFELSFLLSLINHTVEPAYIVSYYSLVDIITCIQLYGPVSGLAVAIFGNKSMLRMQADVLSSLDDIDALEFRKIIQDESAMVGISVGIADETTTLRRITIIGCNHRPNCYHGTHTA